MNIVFIALVMPVIMLLVGFAVDYGALVDSKIRLQIAADRAVFAGAAKLSFIMNKISEKNWGIYQAFLKVDKNFGPNSQQSLDECVKRVKEMENNQTTLIYEDIEDLLQNAYRDAHSVAEDVAKANFATAKYLPVYGAVDKKLFDVLDGGGEKTDEDGDEIRRDIVCANISGIVFDPKKVETKNNEKLLKYTYGDRSYVALIAELRTLFHPPLAGKFFGPIEMTAVSAGQPYGGSMKKFGLLAKEWEGRSIEQVKDDAMHASQNGERALWFRPALVPVEVALSAAGIDEERDEKYFH